MQPTVREEDWKLFRELREVALDRFCKHALNELRRLLLGGSQRNHERYLAVFRVMKERDRTLKRLFDDPRRSDMLWQLAVIRGEGLVTPDEMAPFSAEVRQSVETLNANRIV